MIGVLLAGDPYELIAGVRAVEGGAAFLSPKLVGAGLSNPEIAARRSGPGRRSHPARLGTDGPA